MRDASAFARDMGDYWKRSYDEEKANINQYSKKYSGEQGLKKYKKDFEDPEMSDEEAEKMLKSDIKDMELNAKSMGILAQQMYNIAAQYSSYKLEEIPKDVYKKGEKYAKKWRDKIKNSSASEIPEWYKG